MDARSPQQSIVTVEVFARQRSFPVEYLRELGIENVQGGGLKIPYWDVAGQGLFTRERDCPRRNQRFHQPTGVMLQPYGLWRLPEWKDKRVLFLVEGESDCWAGWSHALPVLGIPGSSATACLKAEHLDGFEDLYVWDERDQGATAFLKGVAKRLEAIGYKGRAWIVSLPECKDICELHTATDATAFGEFIDEVIRRKRPLTVNGHDKHEKNGHTEVKTVPASTQPEIEIPEPPAWPDPIHPDAYYGLAGDIVARVEPQTEADPVAILIQILVMFGNVVNRGGFWMVDETKHFANLFCCLVGQTSLARKGTAKARAIRAFDALGDGWHKRIVSGLSSGEGLISAVKDPTFTAHHVKEDGRVKETQQVMDDPGESDKRLLVIESEFGRCLRAMQREGNTLSPILRSAWDGDDLSSLTKAASNARLRASNPHISLIVHVTPLELQRLYSDAEAAGGGGNRFLWVACRRSKLLPLGGDPVDLGFYKRLIAESAEKGKHHCEIPFDDEAARLWVDGGEYHRLNVSTPGLLGAITDRGAAQVRRLAIIYAMLDQSRIVTLQHLKSALAVWDYCYRSARWAFGESTGNGLADEILALIKGVGTDGVTGTQLRQYLGHHVKATDVGQALAVLTSGGKVRCEEVKTAGRSAKRWFFCATDGTKGSKGSEG